MDKIQLKLNEKGHGAFYISDNGKEVAEMVIGIADGKLTVYHTEVQPEAEGKGLATQLLAAMVDYARTHQLKVIPLCPYVAAQFNKRPDEYADIRAKE